MPEPTKKKVVVGIDGNPASDSAIRWGVAEAVAGGLDLHLVHAFEWPMFRTSLAASDLAPGLRAYADGIVNEAADIARKFDPNVSVTARRVDGFPSPVLLAESRDAELIVIGSRGAGRILSLLISSTGVELATHAHCPVVVVRPGENTLVGNRVLIGYDGSPAAEAAVEFGLGYARRHSLVPRIVSVRSEDKDEEQGLLATLRSHQDTREAELVEVAGHPAELLLEWSADAQLLVVGSRGRGGFTGLFLGSVSQTMLHQATCPVAVIPASAVASADDH